MALAFALFFPDCLAVAPPAGCLNSWLFLLLDMAGVVETGCFGSVCCCLWVCALAFDLVVLAAIDVAVVCCWLFATTILAIFVEIGTFK